MKRNYFCSASSSWSFRQVFVIFISTILNTLEDSLYHEVPNEIIMPKILPQWLFTCIIIYSANVPIAINGAYKDFARFQFLRDKISFPYWTTDTWRHDDRDRIHDAVIPVRHRRHFNRTIRACSRPSCPPPLSVKVPGFSQSWSRGSGKIPP